MKIVVSLLVLATAAWAAPGALYEPVQLNYIENVGIPLARRIKATEESSDFDGARITGGSAAALGQFPYMGGLIIVTAAGRDSVCGSSLLTNTRLVTAAHCLTNGQQNARSLTVVLGSTRLFSGGTRVASTRMVVHPQYNPSNVRNDVAVIVINHVAFNNNIRAINLATGSNTFNGQTARAAGFGLTGDGHQITQNQALRFVDLPVITNQRCATVFGNNHVVASTLCTWGPAGRNTCTSDSGGPLVIGNTLIGITSFGAFRCESYAPSAFARVTSFAAWIRQQL